MTGTELFAGKRFASVLQCGKYTKKLLKLCRAADADTKKAAVGLLKGESSGLSDILGICPAAQAPGRATFSARCLTAS